MRKVIYVGSFDPAHNGHLNTYLKATRILKEHIKICICVNELKASGLFSINERIAIAEATFPTSDIHAYKTYNEIKELIMDSDLIIRGYKKNNEFAEKEYCMRLLSYYDLSELRERLFYVEIDKQFENVSSSMIKELAHDDIDSVSQFVSTGCYSIMKNKFCVL